MTDFSWIRTSQRYRNLTIESGVNYGDVSYPRFIGQTTAFSSRNGIDSDISSHAWANQKKKKT